MIDSRKELYLNRLKKRHSDWSDGDKIGYNHQTVDLVNDTLRIVIELKEDTVTKFEKSSGVIDLTRTSNRFRDDAKSANKKFRNYKSYKSILIIEGNLPENLIKHVFSGIKIIYPNNRTSRYKNRFLSQNTENIGVYLINSWKPNNTSYYLENPYAEKEKISPVEEVATLLLQGFPVKKLFDNTGEII